MRSGKRLQYCSHSWRLLASQLELATTHQPLPLQFRVQVRIRVTRALQQLEPSLGSEAEALAASRYRQLVFARCRRRAAWLQVDGNAAELILVSCCSAGSAAQCRGYPLSKSEETC